MLIDLPVTILFDCDGVGFGRTSRLPPARTFTLRFDTDPAQQKGPVLFAACYPPGPNTHWMEDRDGVLLGHMPLRQEEAICRRAEAEPAAYAADVPANKRAA